MAEARIAARQQVPVGGAVVGRIEPIEDQLPARRLGGRRGKALGFDALLEGAGLLVVGGEQEHRAHPLGRIGVATLAPQEVCQIQRVADQQTVGQVPLPLHERRISAVDLTK